MTGLLVDSDSNFGGGQAYIPRGVADYFWEEAYERRQAEAQLLSHFRAWGYGDVIPPMFEFAETVSTRASRRLQAELYRFLDKDGSTLALRPDMTIAVARLVGTRLHDAPMPQRYCYAGSVFRYTEPQGGRQREFQQTGAELIGVATPDADAEILAMTAKALESVGIDEFRLVIGQIQYFDGLLQDLQLAPAAQDALLHAIDRNSEPELEEFLRTTPLRTQQRRTLEELPRLTGGDPLSVIDRADRLCLNYTMHAALDNLRAICSILEAYDLAGCIYLDLTEIHNLGYYTGLIFEVLTPQLGFAVGSGGRYDQLLGSFGRPNPAVGVALGIDRMLIARRQQEQLAQATRPRPADLLVATANNTQCLRIVQAWRAAGIRVAVDLEQHCGDELWQAARAQGIPRAFTWTGQGFEIRQDAESGTRYLPAAEFQQVVGWVLSPSGK
jgi:ATP phosphoribosyltransferase regulatory subunit